MTSNSIGRLSNYFPSIWGFLCQQNTTNVFPIFQTPSSTAATNYKVALYVNAMKRIFNFKGKLVIIQQISNVGAVKTMVGVRNYSKERVPTAQCI